AAAVRRSRRCGRPPTGPSYSPRSSASLPDRPAARVAVGRLGGCWKDGGMGSTYVISDVHGHLADLRAVLADAGLLAEDDTWSGGDAQLWVLGDLVDRGPEGIGVV